MKIKYTEHFLRDICDKSNLVFVSIHTDKIKNKSRRKIDFICQRHQDKGIQCLDVDKFVSNKKKCGYCNHSKLKETFVDEVTAKNPHIQILSDYQGWEKPVSCKCLIDGHQWTTDARVLLSGSGCPICSYKRRGLLHRNTIDHVKQQLEKVSPHIEIVGDYTTAHNMIKCRCKIDGCEWNSIVANLLNGSAGCPQCKLKSVHDRRALSQSEFVQKVRSINANIEVIGNYYNSFTPVKCRCKIHKIDFMANPRTFTAKDKRGQVCPICVQSNGERHMITTLRSLGLDIQQQYKFSDCKNILPLRFDGYDKIHNIAFEYQGEQHYQPIDFAGKGKQWAEQEHAIVLKRDNIKREYCSKNNIPLIEVPYWELDNMENYLSEQIQQYI